MTTNIFSKISDIDSLEQTRLFYIHKYSNITVEYEGKNMKLLDLFLEIDDLSLIQKLLIEKFSQEDSFDFNGKKITFGELKNTNQKTKILEVAKALKEKTDHIISDLRKYKSTLHSLQQSKDQKENISGEYLSMSDITDFFRKQVIGEVLNSSRVENNKQTDYQVEIDDDFCELFGITQEQLRQTSEKQIQNLAWKYKFFKLVMESVENGYVFTRSELEMINDVVKDLQNGKVVLLTGDTGSGKTEVARFICKQFLKTPYVFISGSKDLDVSDFTIEKTVTSKSVNETTNNIVSGEITDKDELIKVKAKEFLSQLQNDEGFKKAVIDNAPEDKKDEIKQELENRDFNKKSLITEYHLMAVYKAATLGQPLIVDEVNLVRPEVFMALNDLLTKRKGQSIQLPNALGEISVKEGFCIILTGNDPEQNKKSGKYTQGRYNFDEATYNRLRVYAKNYFNQTVEDKKENRIEELDKTFDYLNDNEMYGVILMMMFSQQSDKTISTKYGYEVMKRDSNGVFLDKSGFFEEMKKYANFISQIQKAYSGEIVTSKVNSTLPLKDLIKRKVFSMRNLLEVFAEYKEDNKSLEYHLYQEFIKHTTNTDELYALLVLASDNGFYTNLVTDNQEKSLSNVAKMIDNYPTNYTLDDIENKVVITKQDLYKEYFGFFEIDDEFFEKNLSKIQENSSEDVEEGETLDTNNFMDESSIELTSENILEQINGVIELLNTNVGFFDLSSYFEYGNILDTLKNSLVSQPQKYKNNYSKIHKILIDLNNFLENLDDSSDVSTFQKTIGALSQLTQ